MTSSVYIQISIWEWIEYNGKLASIVREPYDSIVSIYGYQKTPRNMHGQSKHVCSLLCVRFCLEQQNAQAPRRLVRSLWSHTRVVIRGPIILHFLLQCQNKQRLERWALRNQRQDDEDFGRYYGVTGKRICFIRVAHQHVESIAFLNPLYNKTQVIWRIKICLVKKIQKTKKQLPHGKVSENNEKFDF